jgi:hypothetical protein
MSEKAKEETEFERYAKRLAAMVLALGAIGSAFAWAGSTAFVTKVVFADHEKNDQAVAVKVLEKLEKMEKADTERDAFNCGEKNKGADYFLMCMKVGKR